MESDLPKPDVTEPVAPAAVPSEASSGGAPAASDDPKALVDRFIEAGEWPEPELIEQIIAAGEAALGPLLDFLRTNPRGYEREAVLYHAIGILSMIRSPVVIPDLVEIIKRYPEDSGELAGDVLGDFGALGFEPALELIRDPGVTDYPRRHAIQAARRAALADPSMRARLAEVLRPLLADAMERAREEDKRLASEAGEDDEQESESPDVEDLDEEESFEEEDEQVLDEADVGESSEETASTTYIEGPDQAHGQPLEPYEEVLFLVGDLAALADPAARDLIKSAFAENLVDSFWIDEKYVEQLYRDGGEPLSPRREWLENYRDQYQRHIDYLNRPPDPIRPVYSKSRPAELREAPIELHPPAQETIRNTGPKLGRNDPCWCGSGKKYKKCHLGKDGP